MENRQASPVRSRFIRFNLPKRIFPEDFFRGRSQSPKSNSSTLPLTGLKEKNPEELSNPRYWEFLRQQAEKQVDCEIMKKLEKIDKIRGKPEIQERIKSSHQEELPKIRRQFRIQKRISLQQESLELRAPSSLSEKKLIKNETDQGIFTFYGKLPTKAAQQKSLLKTNTLPKH